MTGHFKEHKTSHENGGDDEITVAGLSGELANDQKPKSHDLGGTKHDACSLAGLNAKVSDATLDDSSDPRTPSAHKTSHQDAGADELSVAGLSGELADPQPPKEHDHTELIKVDGTRPFTGNQSMGSNKLTSVSNGTNEGDAINLGQHKKPPYISQAEEPTVAEGEWVIWHDSDGPPVPRWWLIFGTATVNKKVQLG